MSDIEVRVMSPAQIRAARKVLGTMWGLGRPITHDELAEELGLVGASRVQVIARWERGAAQPSGPASRLIQALLAGFRPSRLPQQPEAVKTIPGPAQGRGDGV